MASIFPTDCPLVIHSRHWANAGPTLAQFPVSTWVTGPPAVLSTNDISGLFDDRYSVPQSQKTVTANLKSKQLLPLSMRNGYCLRECRICSLTSKGGGMLKPVAVREAVKQTQIGR